MNKLNFKHRKCQLDLDFLLDYHQGSAGIFAESLRQRNGESFVLDVLWMLT